jgi:mono/diheme cytochrome c family protein
MVGGCNKPEEPRKEGASTSPASPAASEQGSDGEVLFKQQCAPCHPGGGNLVTPKKPLSRKSLQADQITKPEDIVNIMRNPGPGMNRFDESAIPEKEAMAIAEYILKTFK